MRSLGNKIGKIVCVCEGCCGKCVCQCVCLSVCLCVCVCVCVNIFVFYVGVLGCWVRKEIAGENRGRGRKIYGDSNENELDPRPDN